MLQIKRAPSQRKISTQKKKKNTNEEYKKRQKKKKQSRKKERIKEQKKETSSTTERKKQKPKEKKRRRGKLARNDKSMCICIWTFSSAQYIKYFLFKIFFLRENFLMSLEKKISRSYQFSFPSSLQPNTHKKTFSPNIFFLYFSSSLYLERSSSQKKKKKKSKCNLVLPQ